MVGITVFFSQLVKILFSQLVKNPNHWLLVPAFLLIGGVLVVTVFLGRCLST